MVNCQNIRGKKRRSGPLEEKGPLKKTRHDDSETDVDISVSEVEDKVETRKKRLRRRTKGIRVLIKNKIEVALRREPSPLAHLFTTRDDSGTPQAAYVDVIKLIGLSEEDWLKAASLPPTTVESISNITDMFRIETDPEKRLMLKYRPAEWSKENCTVYLDNLPSGCTSEKICRIAKKFGSVVEVRLPRSSSRRVSSLCGVLEMGKHPLSFAFVQFTEPSACDSMCSAFAHNFPQDGEKEKCRSLVPLLQRLLMKIRILSKRRRRRTYAQNVLLMKLRREQAAIIKKERTANKRTCRMSRSLEQEKDSVMIPQKEERIPQNHQFDEENNTSECCGSRRPSFGKKKKVKAHTHKSPRAQNKKKRKRRRWRKTEVGPHAISGSIDDYFARIQVLPFARYLELRREYVALRRESDRRTKEITKEDFRFSCFSLGMDRVKLTRKLDSYRDIVWETHSTEQEE